jgi:hypothetical protein
LGASSTALPPSEWLDAAEYKNYVFELLTDGVAPSGVAADDDAT